MEYNRIGTLHADDVDDMVYDSMKRIDSER
jgi:hypothetical protein